MNWALYVLARFFGFFAVLILMIFAIITAIIAVILKIPSVIVTIISNIFFKTASGISKKIILMVLSRQESK